MLKCVAKVPLLSAARVSSRNFILGGEAHRSRGRKATVRGRCIRASCAEREAKKY